MGVGRPCLALDGTFAQIAGWQEHHKSRNFSDEKMQLIAVQQNANTTTNTTRSRLGGITFVATRDIFSKDTEIQDVETAQFVRLQLVPLAGGAGKRAKMQGNLPSRKRVHIPHQTGKRKSSSKSAFVEKYVSSLHVGYS